MHTPTSRRESGISFHRPVGVVMADVEADRLGVVTAVAEGLGVGFERFEAGKSFGDDRIAVPAGATVLREPSPGGFIDPRRMLAAQLAIARQQGAELAGRAGCRDRSVGGRLDGTHRRRAPRSKPRRW